MQFSTLIPFTFLALAAAQDTSVVAGTVYTKTNYKGDQKAIGVSRCTQLEPPLADHILSIKIGNGYTCRTFSVQGCYGISNSYHHDVPDLHGKPPVNSITCSKSQ